MYEFIVLAVEVRLDFNLLSLGCVSTRDVRECVASDVLKTNRITSFVFLAQRAGFLLVLKNTSLAKHPRLGLHTDNSMFIRLCRSKID